MPTDLWCSNRTRVQDVDPIGTAGCYTGFLLVETPLPWPRDVSEIPELATAAVAKQRGCRIQTLVPEPGRSAGAGILYQSEPGFSRFSGVDAHAEEAPGSVALSLLGGERPSGARELNGVSDLPSWRGRVAVPRTLAVPKCGMPVTGHEKTEDELMVVALEELSMTPEAKRL